MWKDLSFPEVMFLFCWFWLSSWSWSLARCRPLLLVLVWVLAFILAFLGQLWSSICTCLIIVPCLGIPSICLLVVVGEKGCSLPLFRFLLVFVFVFTSLFSLHASASRGRWRRGICIIVSRLSLLLCCSLSFSFTHSRPPSNWPIIKIFNLKVC